MGALYVVLAVGWAVGQLTAGKALSNVVLVAGFIGLPGLVLLYGAYRLPRTDVRGAYYPTIAAWCLGGSGLLLAMLALYQLEPAESVSDPVRAALVLSAFGAAAGFGVGRNDALAKTRAHEIECRNRDLEQLTAQLDETIARLEVANREFADSNERLEQFAYAASHDLQEPLRMVSSYLTLIEKRYGDNLDADGREFIDYAVDGADRMRAMIDGLLAYSRIDSQGKPFEPVALDDVLADARKDLEVRIAESDAVLEIDSLPTVDGDASQLRQLFENLLSNALEYCGDEPPRVRVDAEPNADGSSWTISVADAGIGIDPADADRIFDVFQRLHGPEEYEGTGLGLALCERIVDRHGGRIRVDSDPGEGSTFSVTLPAAEHADLDA
ncbi:phospho-acceptor domain-containing protein [Halopiger aswanensis]|uniref:histidine kinase n=1 Tax=Halopiger aswanensis TaxID=148449 RepID=A0A419WSC4_9EURY|nr:phospho-acceptor domain-containing protein [Halopiger aswanensis]